MVRMTKTQCTDSRVAYVVAGAPTLSIGGCEVRPYSLVVENDTAMVAGLVLNDQGEVTGMRIARIYTLDEARHMPDWAADVRARFDAYASAKLASDMIRDDYDCGIGEYSAVERAEATESAARKALYS